MKGINVISMEHMHSICRAPGGQQVQQASGVSIITSHTNQAYVVHVCETAEAGVIQGISTNKIVCVCLYWDEKEKKQWKQAAVQMPVD